MRFGGFEMVSMRHFPCGGLIDRQDFFTFGRVLCSGSYYRGEVDFGLGRNNGMELVRQTARN
jgi:hypothetical protein